MIDSIKAGVNYFAQLQNIAGYYLSFYHLNILLEHGYV